ncbi:hypothetical protein [Mesorhizobium sp.]|uniref:hypothetical protein n=1 Tax=Mesorhizobium sp. TaxID=1871066 RepID=UPI0025FC42C9|nr:hypothetical protein [Mesorhizobium sp.]
MAKLAWLDMAAPWQRPSSAQARLAAWPTPFAFVSIQSHCTAPQRTACRRSSSWPLVVVGAPLVELVAAQAAGAFEG